MLTIRPADNPHHLNITLIRSEGHIINFLDFANFLVNKLILDIWGGLDIPLVQTTTLGRQ